MAEFEPAGMEKHPVEDSARQMPGESTLAASAIEFVSDHGMAQVREMNADLVSPACLDADSKE